jgi:hypothetical protein
MTAGTCSCERIYRNDAAGPSDYWYDTDKGRMFAMATDNTTDNTATLADLLAAVELGAIDPTTKVVRVDALGDTLAEQRAAGYERGKLDGANAATDALTAERPATRDGTADVVTLPAGVHSGLRATTGSTDSATRAVR